MQTSLRTFGNFGRRLALAAVLATGYFAPAAVAQEAPKAEAPKSAATKKSAADIIDAYVAATGTKEADEKLTSRSMTGTLSVPAAGVKGSLKLLQSAPNNFRMTIEIDGVGKIEQCCDGEIAWEESALSGARLLEGEEKIRQVRAANYNADRKWRDLYEVPTSFKEETIDDKPCYAVELKAKEGTATQTNYYDQKTDLLVMTKTQITSPMGEFEAKIYFEDYRAQDGLTFPFRIRQEILSQEQVIQFETAEHNVKFDDKAFAPTKDVQALIDKK